MSAKKVASGRTITLSIAHDVVHLPDVRESDSTWWCAGEQAKPGDVVVVYKTRQGIRWILEIARVAPERLGWCESHGMVRVVVKVLRVARIPLAAETIRQNRILSAMSGARCNFQGKLFRLEETQLREINRLIVQATDQ